MINRVVLNETSYFGRGSRTKLADEIKNRGYRNILLVSDRVLKEANVEKMVSEVLDNAGITYFEYLDIKPNPTVKNVQDGLRVAQMNNIDASSKIGIRLFLRGMPILNLNRVLK